MNKIIVTGSCGQEHDQMCSITAPLMQKYAVKHGYDFHVEPFVPKGRHASWCKLPLLERMYEKYDYVLWLDVDVVIVDGSQDILDECDDFWQAIVEHHTGEGHIPNCGVWMTTPQMLPFIQEASTMGRFNTHKWWEQAAIIELMGYDAMNHPTRKQRESALFNHTTFLSAEWNWHTNHICDPHHSRFKHITVLPDRLNTIKRFARKSNL